MYLDTQKFVLDTWETLDSQRQAMNVLAAPLMVTSMSPTHTETPTLINYIQLHLPASISAKLLVLELLT